MTVPTPAPASPLRLFYIDDSGANTTGYITYSWIEVTPAGWNTGLKAWLNLRKALYATYKIPPSTELHTTKLIGGRMNPSTDPAVNASKALRRNVTQDALRVIGATPELRIGTVYRQTQARGRAYSAERDAVYVKLVDHLDTRLGLAGEHGMIFMDGDGTDPGYLAAHRDLKITSRRIIEDPIFQASHHSQWMQMADVVAWSTYQSLLRHPGKRFAWHWYAQHLQAIDINGGPLRQ
jgi:hypothetical protein